MQIEVEKIIRIPNSYKGVKFAEAFTDVLDERNIKYTLSTTPLLITIARTSIEEIKL